jgi:hypothetical protein
MPGGQCEQCGFYNQNHAYLCLINAAFYRAKLDEWEMEESELV